MYLENTLNDREQVKNENNSSLRVLIWNIHGLKNETVDTFRNKSESVVKKIFDENDIIV